MDKDETAEPDTSMSRDVASVILRMAGALEAEGRGVDDRPGEVDADAVILKAADIVGRDQIEDSYVLDCLAEIDRYRKGTDHG